jgi:hypothetical protein
MVITREDVDAILEASKPMPTGGRSPTSPSGDYAQLVKLRERDRQAREQTALNAALESARKLRMKK